ncbi:tail fiber assembly protein [Erwinia sp. P7711]|uniref:tail fiber assembly protein n=1 Tax=Erwinia sp. P7711 TaxID=3141451 RepID=UPI003195F1CB
MMSNDFESEVSYSPSQNAFLLNSIKELYPEWPEDAVSVSNEIYTEFSGLVPQGKCRATGNDGLPVWADEPDPNPKSLIETADYEKSRLRSIADYKIAPLEDAVDLGMATDDEKSLLTSWKKYRVNLSRIDTSAAPDLTWPEQPSS